MRETLRTRCSEVNYDADGIVYWSYHEGVRIDGDDARCEMETVAQFLERFELLPARLMIDIRSIGSISREARAIYAEPEASTFAVALLVESAISRVIGNAFLFWSKPAHPTRLFTHEAKAHAWLSASTPPT